MSRADDYIVDRLARLLRWREYVEAIARAAEDVLASMWRCTSLGARPRTGSRLPQK